MPCADKGYEITFSYLLRFAKPREDTHALNIKVLRVAEIASTSAI